MQKQKMGRDGTERNGKGQQLEGETPRASKIRVNFVGRIEKNVPKSIKNHAKSVNNRSQSGLEKNTLKKMTPKSTFLAILEILGDFWRARGPVFSILLDLGVPKGPKNRTLRALFNYHLSNTFLHICLSVFWSGDMRFTRHGAVETHVGRFEQCPQKSSF